jgi:pimeloyl-ACP methyl ester carboxylesterase
MLYASDSKYRPTRWTRTRISGPLPAQAEVDQRSIQEHMRPLAVDGGRPVSVFEAGQGDGIVFLPMMAELNFVYAPQIEEFASDHRVVLWNPRLSTRLRVGIADRAQEALAVMNALGLSSVHIIVWGDTGSAAYYLAKHWPERCKSLVFIGLADRYRLPQPYQLLLQMLRFAPVEDLVPSVLLAWLLGRFVGGTAVKRRWFVERAHAIPRLARVFKYGILPNLVEHQPRLGEVLTPCLVIGGDDDKVVSASQTTRMAGLMPNSRAIIIKGGEHFLNYVDAPRINQLIRGFYASLAS